MKAKSIRGRTTEEIRVELEGCMADGFSPTLAIVFLSVKQDRQAISDILAARDVTIFGATSNGEFIDENYTQGAVAILLLDLQREAFFVSFAALNGVDDRSIAARLAGDALQKFEDPAFIVATSNLQTDREAVLQGFMDAAGPGVNLIGGQAGDDHQFIEDFVFTNGHSTNRGLLALVIDQHKVMVKGRACHGWKAVGTEKTVTRSEGTRLYTIDHVPALDLCLKYSGLKLDTPNLGTELAVNFPFQLQLPGGMSLMRPGYFIHWEDHSITTSVAIPQGSKIRFSLPPDFENIEEVVQENTRMKNEEMPEADALIIFNCGGRLITFGPVIGREVEGLCHIWNVPAAGMFSNAEWGRSQHGALAIHNLTTCTVVLKEIQASV